MVNPGAFRGSRKEFLMSEKANYSAGVAGGYGPEALSLIHRRYFKRYPIDLPHGEEPTPESLAAVDDDAPDADISAPDPERLSPEEYAAAMANIAARRTQIAFRRAQIKRWMCYQQMKDNDFSSKDSGAYNPYNALMVKLTGKEVNRPRCKTGVNVWRKTQREEIETELKNRLGELKGKKDRLAAERDKIAREMFSQLDAEEQKEWKNTAQAEHEELMKEYKKELELASNPSTAPADRQRSIQGLVRFMQPILDMVADVTGWKTTFIAGGPEPAEDGRLNMISVHSGTTTGDVKLNFGCAERERYKKYIVPIYGSFLQKCYTPEECCARALPTEEGYLPMSAMEDDDSFTMFSVESVDSSFSSAFSASTGSASTSPPSDVSIAPPQPTMGTTVAPEDDSPFPVDVHSRTPSPEPQFPLSRLPSPAPSPSPSHARSVPPSPPSPSRVPSPAPLPAPAPAPAQPLYRGPPQALQASLPASTAPPPGSQSLPSQGEPSAPSSLPAMMRHVAEGGTVSPTTQGVIDGNSSVGSPATRSKARAVDLEITGSDTVEMTTKRGTKRGARASESSAELTTEGRRPKRLKASKNVALTAPSTSTPPSTTAAIQAPDESPKWFASALSMVQSADLGPEWAELIRKWAAFEIAEGYKEVSKLGNQYRPSSVKDWIQRARSPTWKPTISDPSKYGQDFLKWWTSLQPKWRISAEGLDFAATDGDWETLRRPGINGLLSVIGSLFHWGAALQKDRREVQHLEWVAAVQDCTTACTALLA